MSQSRLRRVDIHRRKSLYRVSKIVSAAFLLLVLVLAVFAAVAWVVWPDTMSIVQTAVDQSITTVTSVVSVIGLVSTAATFGLTALADANTFINRDRGSISSEEGQE